MADSIGVIGSGAVGEALANGFLKHGYAVMRGSRDPHKLADWLKSASGKAVTGTMEETRQVRYHRCACREEHGCGIGG